MQPVASLRVLVDVDASKGTKQLALFDTNLKATAKSATAYSKEMDGVTASAKQVTPELRKAGDATDLVADKNVLATQKIEKTAVAMGTLRKSVGGVTHEFHRVEKSVSVVRWPGAIAGAATLAEAVNTAAGGIAALASAIGPLTGLLASGAQMLTVYGQTAGTIALSGVNDLGTAVGGLNEKLDEEAEAFKKLSPQAQEFARALDEAKGPMRDIRNEVQGRLFGGLEEAIGPAIKGLRAMQPVFNRTASALGDIAMRFANFVGSKSFATDFRTIGDANTKILRQLGGVLIRVAKAFQDTVVAAQPLTKWLGNLFTRWSKGLRDAAAAGRESGDLADFFRRTRDVTKDLISIFKNFGGALMNILKLGEPLGREILDRLRASAREFRVWTESAGGKNKIKEFFEAIRKPLFEAGRLVGDFVSAYFRIQTETAGTFAPMMKEVRTELLPLFEKLVTTTSAALGPKLIDLLGELGKHLLKIAGTSGPLEVWLDVMTKIIGALNWMMEHIPGFQTLVVTLMSFSAISKAMEFSGAVLGVSRITAFTQAWTQASIAMQAGQTKIGGLVGVMAKVQGAMFALGNTTLVLRGRLLLLAATGKITAAMSAIGAAVRGLSITVRGAMLATGIGALIVGAGLIIAEWDKVKPVLESVWNWIKGAAKTVGDFFAGIWEKIAPAARVAWDAIKLIVKGAWAYIKLVTAPARIFLTGVFKAIKAVAGPVWDVIKTGAKVAWKVISTAAKVAWELIKAYTAPARALLVGAFRVIRDVGSAVWGAIKSAAKTVFDWLETAAGDVAGAVKDVWRGVGTFFEGLWQGILRIFGNAMSFLLDGVSTVTNAIADMVGTLGDISILGVELVPGADAAGDALASVTDSIRATSKDLDALGEDTKISNKRQADGWAAAAAAAKHSGKVQGDAAEATSKHQRDAAEATSRHQRQAADATDKNQDRAADSTKRNQKRSREITSIESKRAAEVAIRSNDRMVNAVGRGHRTLLDNTGKAMGALGDRKVLQLKIQLAKSNEGGMSGFQQGGAMIVPGTGSGDKVPVQAMTEPGEGVFVVNRNAMGALEMINSLFPRMQRGGALNFALGPHAVPPIQYAADHAGGNSHWHITGTTTPWVVAIGKQLQQMGFMVGEHPAFGGVGGGHSATGGHYDALAIDVNSALDETLAESKAVARILGGAGIGIVEKIRRVLLKGPEGALRDMGQRSLDNVWRQANKFLSKQVPMGVAPPSSTGSYGKPQLMALWRQAGGPRSRANLAAAVALAESGGDPNAKNVNTNGSIDRGLWQINSIHGALSTFDPLGNAKAAVKISSQGSDWAPWVAYMNGLHTQYLQRGSGRKGIGGRVERIWSILQEFLGGGKENRALGQLRRLAQHGDRSGKLVQNLFSMVKDQPGFGKREEEQLMKLLQAAGPFGSGKREDWAKDLRNTRKRIARTQETIDLVSRKAGAEWSASGSELSGGERDRLIRLHERLLGHWQRIKEVSKLGMKTASPGPFKAALTEAVGLTGKGGAIADTAFALKELRRTPIGQFPEGLDLATLLEFVQLAKYGVFDKLPVGHSGGIYRAPPGQTEGPAILADGERVTPAGEGGGTVIYSDIYIGDEIVAHKVRHEIRRVSLETQQTWRAGRRP